MSLFKENSQEQQPQQQQELGTSGQDQHFRLFEHTPDGKSYITRENLEQIIHDRNIKVPKGQLNRVLALSGSRNLNQISYKGNITLLKLCFIVLVISIISKTAPIVLFTIDKTQRVHKMCKNFENN